MKLMKTKNFFLKSIFFTFALVLAFGATFFVQKQALAQESLQSVADGHVQLSMSAKGRLQSSIAPTQQEVENSVGQHTTFFCFNWRDLHSLTFQFSAVDESIITNFQFLLTYVRSESLNSAFGTNNATTLYEGRSIASQNNFIFYIDPSSVMGLPNSANGNGFGLYKFDLCYSRLVDNQPVQNHVEICVAVFADKIDEIEIPLGTQITYHITSSNKLMNIFNCNLSSSLFRFVNPDFLQWEVVGQDTNGISYCLDKKMQQQMEYGAYQPLWDSLQNTTGTSFVFDSNDVEGTWTVSLSIKNSDGTEKANFKIKNLSTIKVNKPFPWWIVLVVIFGSLLLVGLVVTIVLLVKKKHEKVW